MSDRDQTVIPVEIRRAIGLGAHQRVDVTVERGTVCIRLLVPMPLAAAQSRFRAKPMVDVMIRERRRDR